MLTIIGASDPGRREHNEDSFVADSALGFGLVADGMGGYACGEVASDLVQQTVHEAVKNDSDLSDAIRRAHNIVIDAANADAAKKGMGSTVVAVKFTEADYNIAWVGDSRAYLWDQLTGVLTQITRDHSYVEALVSSGAISAQEALNHPHRHLITQAMGVAGEEGLVVDAVNGRLDLGQKLILCSDGLVDEVEDQEIARILATTGTPDETVNKLILTAVKAGGRDNITVVMAFNDKELGALESERADRLSLDKTDGTRKNEVNDQVSERNENEDDTVANVSLTRLELISIQLAQYFNKIVKLLRK
jgi:serine/threonine protein phosphatase PrpC